LNKFPKSERLHSAKLIDELFAEGTSFTVYPLRVVYLKQPLHSHTTHQVLVTIPKKRFKRAVDRNKMKRRIKEAYRLHKQVLNSEMQKFSLVIGYIYVGRDIASYQEVEEKLKESLLRLKEIADS
jgi:ribonuclease P protein component